MRYVQRYRDETVLEAARRRMAWVFDRFETIIVSVSGGKDSTVLAHLALEEAERRERKVGLFFLDEEVIYQSTVDQVSYLMGMKPAHTNRLWLQIPFRLTNATSLTQSQLVVWEPGKHKVWMRSKGSNNIVAPPWGDDPTVANKAKGFGFYDAIENFEACYRDAAFLVGLRGTEGPNRWRAVSKNPVQVNGDLCFWGTAKRHGNVALYPIYDWNFHDVWRYIHETGLRYSKVYDWQFMKGFSLSEIRCSSLIHERSFKSLVELPEFEPKTYERLLRRVKGIAFAQENAKSGKVFRATKRPRAFATWRAYRDHLLAEYPDPERRVVFERRFARHLDNEHVARQQCRQLVLGDYENNVPVRSEPDPRDELIEYYRRVL